MNEITDVSFGIIPIRLTDDVPNYLLIQHRNGGHWSFPKGHRENSETDLQAALRELYEETGLRDVFVCDAKQFNEKYKFKRNSLLYDKTVHYYLASTIDKNVNIQGSEVLGYAWVPFEAALNLITFPEGRTLLTEVHSYVQW